MAVETVLPCRKDSYTVICRGTAGNLERLSEEGVFSSFRNLLRERMQMDIWCGAGSSTGIGDRRTALPNYRRCGTTV